LGFIESDVDDSDSPEILRLDRANNSPGGWNKNIKKNISNIAGSS
jgi:hypothetical protein